MALNSNPSILVFTDWYLPGYRAGGPIRSVANLLDQMSGEVQFKIVTRDRDYLQKQPYSNLQVNQWISVNGGQAIYLSPDKVSVRYLKKIIRESEESFIYINGIYSFYFSILPAWYAKLYGKKVIISPRGMLSESAINIKSAKKQLFLRLASWLNLFNHPGLSFHATSNKEARDIRRELNSNARIVVAENFPRIIPNKRTVPKKKDQLKMFAIARVAPEKNISFALQCLKLIDNNLAISFDIFGEVYDQNYLNECLKVKDSLPDGFKINFRGSVSSSDIPEVLSSHHLFFLPTLGENYGHAIAESLLAGVPVLISDQTPWKDLQKKGFGADLPLGNPQKFAEVIEHYAKLDEVEHNWLRENICRKSQKLFNLKKVRNSYRELFSQ